MHKPLDDTPFRVGSLLVRRVPASSVRYCAIHTSWRGYLFQDALPIEFLEKAGKLIEVRSKGDLDAERYLYRARMKPGNNKRLTYYEVIDADA